MAYGCLEFLTYLTIRTDTQLYAGTETDIRFYLDKSQYVQNRKLVLEVYEVV